MSELRGYEKFPRRSYGAVKEVVSLPDLIEVQSKSFNDFVQLDFLPEERENVGLEQVLRNVFPIEHGDRFSLKYCGYELGDWSCICGDLKGIESRYTWKSKSGNKKGVGRLSREDLSSGKASYIRCSSCHARVSVKSEFTAEECRYSGKTYSLPLKLKLQLVTWDEGGSSGRVIRDIKEQDVFICPLPVMVDVYEDEAGNIRLGSSGTFLINGVSRVVVSQIHRAAGLLFTQSKKVRAGGTGVGVYGARIIPARGVWLDFEYDQNGILFVKIDKKKKLHATTFLQALGVDRDSVLDKIYGSRTFFVKKGKFFAKADSSLRGARVGFDIVLKDSEKIGLSRGVRLTEKRLQDLQKKIKSEFLELEDSSVIGSYLSSRMLDSQTGEVIAEAGSVIDEIMLGRLCAMGDLSFNVVITKKGEQPTLVKTLINDNVYDSELAAREVYSRVRPGDSPAFNIVRSFIDSMLYSQRMYDLTFVGRLRINRKLGLDFPIDKTTLCLEDVLGTIKYLVNLQEIGEGEIDDVDHLSNRCVRLVDELLKAQMYLGFSRIEKIAREKLRLMESGAALMPHDFINVKPMGAVLNAFFGTGQLSQFMDQTNPLAEMAHKRRLSALGPGGISRERATLDVRDVHSSHYGRICPIETPDGHNIGLISSLATFSRVNNLGFIETTYRPVVDGFVQGDQVKYLDAFEEKGQWIAQAGIKIDASGKIVQKTVLARRDGVYGVVDPKDLDFVDASTLQLVSVATALIPFLENDDANRALMGSNMQRQAVPLICPRPPLVGTGMEKKVAKVAGVAIVAKNSGVVSYVSAEKVIVSTDQGAATTEEWATRATEVYRLRKFNKSSHNTWLHYVPAVRVGDYVSKGDVVANCQGVADGEVSLGNTVRVAFLPWLGYNFEDAIVISKRLVSDDVYTSVHLEEFVVEARDTKLGAEEITRDIPNISDRDLDILDDEGIVKVGTRVTPGDILVAKATLKGDVQVAPEEKLLRAIFGDKSREVRDTSSRVPPGVEGTVIDVKVFSRGGIRKDKRYKDIAIKEAAKIEADFAVRISSVKKSFVRKLNIAIEKLGGNVVSDLVDTFEELCKIAQSKNTNKEVLGAISELLSLYKDRIKVLGAIKNEEIAKLRRGDELPSGVIKMVRVYVAMKRSVSVGDKMAGRHGNKGVVSKIVDVEDLPYTEDGQPVDVVLNPCGVPGRMNLGQILETIMGMVCSKIGSDLAKQIKTMTVKSLTAYLEKYLGKDHVTELMFCGGEEALWRAAQSIAKEGMKIATPVFDGADFSKDILPALKDLDLPENGEFDLYDGRTGEKFAQKVTVGMLYMLKLNHMANDKIHARSVGPYSLITQQPLGGKAQFGGQRLGEMEVWALFAYGAAYTLQEMLTIKSDDVSGRLKAYEAMVHGEEIPTPGLPESFNVLVKELQSLCLNLDLFKANEEFFSE